MRSCHFNRRPAGLLRRALTGAALLFTLAATGGAALAQAADTPPAGYTRCAGEGQACSFSGTASVVYGARSTWTAPRGFSGGSVACGNAVFGDPLYGVVKACYAQAGTAPPPPPPPPPTDTPPAGYTRCASEGQACSFSGTANVVYGALGTWTAPRSFSGGTACSNAVFGDPLFGVAKSCYQQAAATAKFSLSLTLTGTGGVGFSDGSACAASCVKSFDAGSSVTLAASPAAGHSFTGWGGACSGTGGCTVAMNAAKSVSAAFSPVAVPPPAAAPMALYTDVVSGPTSGGESNRGAYLSIFGKNFGAPAGLGSATKVYIGGVEVAGYRFLGASKVGDKQGIQQLSVQVGLLGGAAQGVALPVKVMVGGVASNTNLSFMPNPGRILFVDNVAGNDATAVPGDITKPYRHVQTPALYTGGAWPVARAGDMIVLRGRGATNPWTDVGFENYFMRFRDKSGSATTGAPGTGAIALMGYPGEDAYIRGTVANGMTGGCVSGINGQSFPGMAQWVVVSNLRMDCEGYDGPISQEIFGHNWRVVNNDLSASTAPRTGSSIPRMAGITGNGNNAVWYGNHIHDIQGSSGECHGIYIDGDGSYDIAYNDIHDIRDGNGFQVYVNGGNGTDAASNISLHHNWIHDVSKHGVNIADGATNNVKVWNNVVFNVRYAAVRFNTYTLKGARIFNNTFYNTNVAKHASYGAITNDWNLPSGSLDIENNIFFVVAGTPYNSGSNGVPSNAGTINRNLWFNGTGGTAFDTAALTANPLFTAPGSDFHLQAASPAIGAGARPAVLTALVTNDFDLKPRGAAMDLGAYAFAPGAAAAYALQVSTNGMGSVNSVPGGIQCGAGCSASFNSGTVVALTATPAAGNVFSGWAGACSGTGGCSVTMDAAKSVTATFAAVEATTKSLTVTVAGLGGVGFGDGSSCTATCTKAFNTGSSVTVSAAPAAGYVFMGWGGACTGTAGCVVNMDAAKGVTATFVASTATLSVSVSGLGAVNSTPSGINCGGSCTASFAVGSNVVLTATPSPGSTFAGWSGACSGTAACTVTLSAATSVGAAFSSGAPAAGAPVVLYTDALSGPVSGGEGGKGAYLSIFGKNFGAASGLGSTTKVQIGGCDVANYRHLGAAKVGAKLGVQQIAVQVGGLCNAPLGQPLPIKVTVAGQASNTDNTFTPSSGRILFVSLAGNDTTAVAGDIARPWRHLQNLATVKGAYFAMGAGDHVVIRGGDWSDADGWDGTWMRAGGSSSSTANARNGTASAWIHITAYPGPIDGNAPEDVHYTTPAGKSGGIAGPWSAITGTSGEYWSVSNLRMDVNAAAASDAAPINTQYTAGPWRVVNNELGPWPVAGVSSAKAGGISGYGNDVKILGNHIHDIGGTSALENHGIYAGVASNWEVGHNWIHDITGGTLVQFHDSSAVGGTYALPHGGTWMGYTGIRVHHNWLENAAKYGLNISDAGSEGASVVEYRAWNNVIKGTRLPPFRTNSTARAVDITFAHNTVYDAMVSNSGSGNGYFRNEDRGVGSVRIFNNLLAIGPRTVNSGDGFQWFFDYSGNSGGWSFKNNLYWDAGRGVATPAADGAKVVGDPKFTNAAAGDLSLQAASPAVNKALQALPFAVVDDFTAATARPQGGVSDIGAFERKP
jgi:hypothetical protein